MSSKINKICIFCKSIALAFMVMVGASTVAYRHEICQYLKPVPAQTVLQTAMVNGKIQNIDDILTAYLNTRPEASAIAVFKFIPDENNAIYKGQVNIVTSYRREEVQPNQWDPELGKFDGNIQDILFNKVHYETVKSVQVLCEKIYSTKTAFSCEKSKIVEDDVKSIVTIPVLNEQSYAVTGYVLVVLHDEYTKDQINKLVQELSPYMQKIQPIISGVTLSDMKKRA